MNRKQKIAFILISLSIFALILSGCSSNQTGSKTDSEETPITRLVEYSKENIDRSMDIFRTDFDTLKAKVDAATKESAQDIKKEVHQLQVNITSFDKEMTQAVENGKLADDLKKSYDTAIETMKTDLDNLNTALDNKE